MNAAAGFGASLHAPCPCARARTVHAVCASAAPLPTLGRRIRRRTLRLNAAASPIVRCAAATPPLQTANAPVIKGVMLACAAASIIAQSSSTRRVGAAAAAAAAAGGGGGGLGLRSLLAFSAPSELMLGSLLLYYARLVERQSGSGKFGAFALSTSAAAALLSAGARRALAALRGPGTPPLAGAPSGPYGLLFACLVQLLLDVPTTQHFALFGARARAPLALRALPSAVAAVAAAAAALRSRAFPPHRPPLPSCHTLYGNRTNAQGCSCRTNCRSCFWGRSCS